MVDSRAVRATPERGALWHLCGQNAAIRARKPSGESRRCADCHVGKKIGLSIMVTRGFQYDGGSVLALGARTLCT